MVITIIKPVIVGSYAFKLTAEEKAAAPARHEGMTHRWHLLVRSADGSGLGWVRTCSVELDATFAEPRRALTKEPFEVRELGWGEFPIHVSLGLADPAVAPVRLTHLLRLNHDPPHTKQVGAALVSETLEDVVFEAPTPAMYAALTRAAPAPEPCLKAFWLDHAARAAKTRDYLLNCQYYITSEIARTVAFITHTSQDISTLQRQYVLISGYKKHLTSNPADPTPPQSVDKPAT